jgi:hypothetical protein
LSVAIDNDQLAGFVTQRFNSSVGSASRRGRVLAIDGPDCSGKTSLAEAIYRLDQDAWHVLHIDDLVSSEVLDADRAEFSLQSFLLDYFPVQRCANAIADEARAAAADERALLVEGLFLARSTLLRAIDYLVRLDIPPPLVVRRALSRDVGVLGDEPWVRRHYETQCLPAQAVYCALVSPASHAHLHLELRSDERSWRVTESGTTE